MGSSKNIGLKSIWVSFAVFFSVCIGYYINSLLKTDGHYTYPLDDAYIHLAMAKNFALHKVWGITQHQFSSTSSSPLFTFILSLLIKVFGNNDQIPLYFNLFFCIFIVSFLNQYYYTIFNDFKNTLLSVLFTLFFAVIHLQFLAGMEHIFQVFLFVVNIFCFHYWNKSRWAVFGFYGSILLMGVVRFESMFYFVILAFVLALIRRWKDAVCVLIIGFLPVAVFCFYNYQQCGYFLPNSVIVKGTKLSFDSNFPNQLKVIFLDNFLLNTSFYKIGLFPIVLCVIYIYKDIKAKKITEAVKDNFFLVVFSLLMICHAMFADLKGMFRYEAYLLVGFSMALIPKVKDFFLDSKSYIRKEKMISLLLIMNILLMSYKLRSSHKVLNNGGKNIYEQQVQSAKFLNTYYNASKIVANDIGAITYYTDIHLLDIAGLGSKETIRFNENKKHFDQTFEDFLTHYSETNQYDLAIIYEDWLQGYVPKSWKKVATLTIQNKITVSRDEVSIYSVNKENLQELKQNIKKFNWNRNVKVTILD